MKKKNHIKQLMVALPLIFGAMLAPLMSLVALADSYACTIDFVGKTYSCDGASATSIPSYNYTTGYDNFVSAKTAGTLPKFYITNFLYDGEDIINNTESAVPSKLLLDNVLNINTTGGILFTGVPESEEGWMLAFDTNNLAADTDLYFDKVNINSERAGAPAIYIYNKDPNYKEHKVSLNFIGAGTTHISGGCIDKSAVTDRTKTLFATTAGSDGKYYYSAGASISSDIDLTVRKIGSHSGVSLRAKAGTGAIESKGDLTIESDGELGSINLVAKKIGLKAGGDVNFFNAQAFIVLENNIRADAVVAGKAINIDGSKGAYGIVYVLGSTKAGTSALNSVEGVNVKNSDSAILAIGMSPTKISENTELGVMSLNFTEVQPANSLVAFALASSGQPLGAVKFGRAYSNLTYSAGFITKDRNFTVWGGGTIDDEKSVHKVLPPFEDNRGDPIEDSAIETWVNAEAWSLDTKMKHTVSSSNESPTLFSAASITGYDGVEPSGSTDRNTNEKPNTENGTNTDDTDDPEYPEDPEDPEEPENPDTPINPNPGGNSSNSGSSNNSGSNSNNSSSTNSDSYIQTDTEDVAVPYTSVYTPTTTVTETSAVVSPDTGRVTREGKSVKAVSPFAWAVSIASAATLVLYVLISRKKHAIRFRK